MTDPGTSPPRDLAIVEDERVSYIVRAPTADSRSSSPPLLCFLHGYDEGPPTPVREGLTRHGPLREGSPRPWVDRFLVVAPQLPTRGDVWRRYAEDVRRIVLREGERHGSDAKRAYLTGFSFGGNGAFDLALEQPGSWAAVWAVDPTRVPPRTLGVPVWVSMGEVARHQQHAFVRRLGLRAPARGRDRIWTDEGADHVTTARRAYADARIYAWLLARGHAPGRQRLGATHV